MIAAERTIAAPRERVFTFLALLPNHWQLHDALVQVEATAENEARVQLVGPLGLSREAHTRVVAAEEPMRLRGVADVAPRTKARVAWDLDERDGGTHIRLSTWIDEASLADRLLLVLGGAWWLRRVYTRALANLERAVTG